MKSQLRLLSLVLLLSWSVFGVTPPNECETALTHASGETAIAQAAKRHLSVSVRPDHSARIIISGSRAPWVKVSEAAINFFAQPFGLRRINRFLKDIGNDPRPVSIYQKANDALRLKVETAGTSPEELPKTGPLLVIANHPKSGAEGTSIGAVLTQQRPDVKIVLNKLLFAIPGIPENAIGVDVANPANRQNVQALKEMQTWLKDGHVLVIFPAGDVSRVHKGQKIATDGPWSKSIIRMTKRSGTPILPIFVHGQPSGLFRMLDKIHSSAASSIVPHEILRQDGTTMKLTLGKLVDAKTVTDIADENEAVQYLRDLTYELGGIHEASALDHKPSTQ